mmetsp:Transcript_35938/g.106224  ORF Transcript_35938/g.106224 Transcript_35938/m.106224 type:complete len:284 (-) Transcript_35938:819-1670(-)
MRSSLVEASGGRPNTSSGPSVQSVSASYAACRAPPVAAAMGSAPARPLPPTGDRRRTTHWPSMRKKIWCGSPRGGGNSVAPGSNSTGDSSSLASSMCSSDTSTKSGCMRRYTRRSCWPSPSTPFSAASKSAYVSDSSTAPLLPTTTSACDATPLPRMSASPQLSNFFSAATTCVPLPPPPAPPPLFAPAAGCLPPPRAARRAGEWCEPAAGGCMLGLTSRGSWWSELGTRTCSAPRSRKKTFVSGTPRAMTASCRTRTSVASSRASSSCTLSGQEQKKGHWRM